MEAQLRPSDPRRKAKRNAGPNTADLQFDMNYCSEMKSPNYAEIVNCFHLDLNGYSDKREVLAKQGKNRTLFPIISYRGYCTFFGWRWLN